MRNVTAQEHYVSGLGSTEHRGSGNVARDGIVHRARIRCHAIALSTSCRSGMPTIPTDQERTSRWKPSTSPTPSSEAAVSAPSNGASDPGLRRIAARDTRDWRDGRDGQRFEVRSSRFSELRTLNFELRIAPSSHVSRLPHQSLWPLMPWTCLARSRSRPRSRRLPVAVHSPRLPA